MNGRKWKYFRKGRNGEQCMDCSESKMQIPDQTWIKKKSITAVSLGFSSKAQYSDEFVDVQLGPGRLDWRP